MIKIEIVADNVVDFLAKLRGVLAGSWVPPSAPVVVPENSQTFDPSVPAGTIIPVEQARGESLAAAVVRTAKRRATKGAGSEPEVVEPAQVVTAEKVVEPEPITSAQVREALLALLPDGKGGGVSDEAPEEVLTQFGVKKISGLTPEQFPAVHAAAVKRLAEAK